MNQIFIFVKATFILLLIGHVLNAHAGSNKLSCAAKGEQQSLGALPGFSHDSDPLLGYQCQLIPHYSGFLGNWFPALPNVYISQSNRLLTSNSDESNTADKAKNDDNSQAWKIAFSIKRLGQSQISIFSEQKEWQQILEAKETISFIPAYIQNASDAIVINNGQQAQLNRKEKIFGFSFILPFQSDKILTELRIQKAIITQPIQANVLLLKKQSLFSAQAEINEIMILSQSFHKGLNINWQFGLGKGDITLEPEEITRFDSKFSQIVSLRGQLEINYQYRFNRRWFTHLGWQGAIHYWQQGKKDDSFQLADANTIEQSVFLGIGFTF